MVWLCVAIEVIDTLAVVCVFDTQRCSVSYPEEKKRWSFIFFLSTLFVLGRWNLG